MIEKLGVPPEQLVLLAVILVLTNDNGILKNKPVYMVLNTIINIIRSIPFIILMVFIMPLTKAVVGTRIGTTAALIPLIVFITPYLTRLFENSILDVNKGIVEAAQAMGASYYEIVRYFLLPEAKGSLILSITTGTIGLIGAKALLFSSALGVVVLIIFVQIIQTVGNHFAYKTRNH